MLSVHFILCSFLFLFQTSFSNSSTQCNNDQNKQIKITPLYPPDISEEIYAILNKEGLNPNYISNMPEDDASKEIQQIINEELFQNLESTKKKEFFDENDTEEMEIIFQSLSRYTQHILKCLQKPDNPKILLLLISQKPEFNNSLIQAKAIAYQMKKYNWKSVIFSIKPFLRLNNETLSINSDKISTQFKTMLNSIETSSIPTILIISELDKFFECTNEKNTVATFSTFLKKQDQNRKFLFIGFTTTPLNELPRFEPCELEFKNIVPK